MNIFGGMVYFDGRKMESRDLQSLFYHSPKWQPDHQDTYCQKNVGLVATQRFINHTSSRKTMPYHHAAAQCMLVADSYLTYKDELAQKLGMTGGFADCELIMAAYLRWGEQCTQHLIGCFGFAIWDARAQKLFMAHDHFAQRPVYYVYTPSHSIVFSNNFIAIKQFCNSLSINFNMIACFALDALPDGETCYQEIDKLAAAEQIVVTPSKLSKQTYWSFNTNKQRLSYKTRQACYDDFQACFKQAVQEYLHVNHVPLAHISGGLDSSSVAAVAAYLLAKQAKQLYGFTAIPKALNGASYRPHWRYHELDIVKTLLQQYPNIKHYVYRTQPERDPFVTLSQFYQASDQPYRNVCNFEWIINSYVKAYELGSRNILVGVRGNGSISWSGQSWATRLKHGYHTIRDFFNLQFAPHHLYGNYYVTRQYAFLQQRQSKSILNKKLLQYPSQMALINNGNGRSGSVRPIEFYYGIENHDPTNDLKVIEFCNNLPQSFYLKNRERLSRRLLVREGLAGFVPEEIRKNKYRGEQAADWFLHYNQYREQWWQQLQNINANAQEILWHIYDRKKITAVFNQYPTVTELNKQVIQRVRADLYRCFSLGYYLNEL